MIDTNTYETWLNRQQESVDLIVPAPLRRLAALLDHSPGAPCPWTGQCLPPLGHWLFHLPDTPQSALGPDGHPQRGDFLPPIPLPRRLWAGSRIRFHREISLGSEVIRRSTVTGIKIKTHGSGKAFITLRHEVLSGHDLLLTEEQDIVYLDEQRPPASANVIEMSDAQVVRTFTADPAILFRYSALTFNAHRIHYDRHYATSVERHPGLVVHGPLIATLLMDQFLRRRPDAQVRTFECRARVPTFDGLPFQLCLNERNGEVGLWAQSTDGVTLMSAALTFGVL